MAAVTNQVIVRSNMGRFIADCEGAATKTVMEVADKGSNISRALAPKRTGRLAASIKPFLVSRTAAVWGTNVDYAMHQEKGTRRHPMSGRVSFFWMKMGRPWYPYNSPEAHENIGGPGTSVIDHPGNPGVHYLENGYNMIKGAALKIADKHYPG